jgi:Mn2+/Fe2+ NRAMP family transporter
MASDQRRAAGVSSGAAFLMAVSAIGPGFLTQTTDFTAKLGAGLAFAILVSIVIDIGAQLTTWRVICISGRRGQEVADAVLPGLRWLLITVIVAGAFVFNIGNLSGCALALDKLAGWPQPLGASLSALTAVGLFLLPGMMTGVDWFSKVLGFAMILMTFYIVFATNPPLAEAAHRAVWPEKVNYSFVVTLVGGTVGGYIMFSGAHRLLDGGVHGPEQVGLITWASIQGIVITGIMRVVLFLAVLGVVQTGASLSEKQPVFDAFQSGAGDFGLLLSCLVFWAAAITSVVGCGYTSISFLYREATARPQARPIIAFTVVSLLATVAVLLTGWDPSRLLIFAGAVNGILLPVILGVLLVAAYCRSVIGDYRHPWWAGALGLLAWVGTLFLAYHWVRTLAG